MIILSVRKSISSIQNEMRKIVSAIAETLKTEPIRNLDEIEIRFGKTPEFYESFGVVREKNRIIFGDWIDLVEPLATRNHFWEFLIIRESFSLFFSDDLIFGQTEHLIKYYLNLLALSFMQNLDSDSAKNIKVYPIKGRFFAQKEKMNEMEKELNLQINSIISSIKQGVTYKMLFSTFMSFIDDVSFEDIDDEELLGDIKRYLSTNNEEIAAPIRLKKNTTNVLEKLIELGFNSSSSDISKSLDVNPSTIARQINKISSKFNAKWRLEKNYKKLGLSSYLVIIRFDKNSIENLDYVSKELLEIKYLQQFFEGKGSAGLYQYSVLHCPEIVSEKIARKLDKLQKEKKIKSFELIAIFDREFRTAIVTNTFKATLANFRKLINGEIPYRKVILWNNSHHKNQEKEIFSVKDIPLLKFISIIISKSISKFGLFGAHFAVYRKFIEKSNIDVNNISESINYLNKLQNLSYERGLFDFRFKISMSGIESSEILVIRILEGFQEKDISALCDQLSCFSWVLIDKAISETILFILGPNYNHPLTELIKETIKQYSVKTEIFSAKSKMFRIVEYEKLYDFESKRWIL